MAFGLGRKDDSVQEYEYQNYDDREIRIKSESGKYLRSQTLALSKDQITFAVASRYTIKAGDGLKLEFQVPGGQKIAWMARVDYVTSYESPQMPGVKNWKAIARFQFLPDEHVATIEAAVKMAIEKLEQIRRYAVTKDRPKWALPIFNSEDLPKIGACLIVAGILVGGTYLSFKNTGADQLLFEKTQEMAGLASAATEQITGSSDGSAKPEETKTFWQKLAGLLDTSSPRIERVVVLENGEEVALEEEEPLGSLQEQEELVGEEQKEELGFVKMIRTRLRRIASTKKKAPVKESVVEKSDDDEVQGESEKAPSRKRGSKKRSKAKKPASRLGRISDTFN